MDGGSANSPTAVEALDVLDDAVELAVSGLYDPDRWLAMRACLTKAALPRRLDLCLLA